MKTKLNKKMAGCLLGLSSLLLAGQANANAVNTVFVDPASSTQAPGSAFNVNVRGDFETITTGGGFLLSWDDDVIHLVSTSTQIDNSLVANGFDFSTAAVSGMGTLALDVLADVFFGGPFSGAFPIVELAFEVHDPATFGGTPLGLAPATIYAPDGNWFPESGFDRDVDVSYVGGRVDVSAVPVPAAVWLFGSGLIGLVGVARRRKLAQA